MSFGMSTWYNDKDEYGVSDHSSQGSGTFGKKEGGYTQERRIGASKVVVTFCFLTYRVELHGWWFYTYSLLHTYVLCNFMYVICHHFK